uniref:Uncharacterized protein n=1 Tax=Arundo donax TaxID=35708 RepID=A0A0A9HGG9_ARUDO
MTSCTFNCWHRIEYTAHFVKFVLRPEAVPKMDSSSWTILMSSFFGLTKIAASSAYMLVRILAALCCIDCSCPASVAKSNNRCRGSIARMKSMGNRGSPCRNPVQWLKLLPLVPLSKTEDEAVDSKAETRSLHRVPNPNLSRTSIR